MADISIIGKTISELRKIKGSTQEELAAAVGVSAQAVSKWENGGTPDTDLLPLVADYFEITVDRLFGRKTSTNLCESVHDYVYEPGQFKGFDRAFSVYYALHNGLVSPVMPKLNKDDLFASHNSDENGYSLFISNGYGNFVKRNFWESVNLDTANFTQNLFFLLAGPGMIKVLFSILRRKVFGPANFDMIKISLKDADCPDEIIQGCLDKLTNRGIIKEETSPYDEIGKTYRFNDEWYLGICALICAAQALKVSLPGFSCYLGTGAWPINL